MNFFIWATITDQRLEIRKCDLPTYQLTNQLTNQLTWVGARDTCVSKNIYTGIGWSPIHHQKFYDVWELNDCIYLSFSNIVLGSKPVIVVLDEEDVDEDGGVDEEGEGDDEEEGPLNPHLRSRLHERRPLQANLRKKVGLWLDAESNAMITTGSSHLIICQMIIISLDELDESLDEYSY